MALTPMAVGGVGYRAVRVKPRPIAALQERYPHPDTGVEGRLLQDLADLLHENPLSADATRRYQRWISLVLEDIAERGRWWFLEAVAARWLNAGDDVIDVVGHVGHVVAVFAPGRVRRTQLSTLLEKRQEIQASGGLLAGDVERYALEAGRRLHLFPAPRKRIPFAVLYTRPMHVDLLPSNFEGIVLDGVLGRYGRHFDRDALTQDPAEFERRYETRLARSLTRTGHLDLETIERWSLGLGTQAGTSLAAANGSTEIRVPESLRGIEYSVIEDEHYPFEVE